VWCNHFVTELVVISSYDSQQSRPHWALNQRSRPLCVMFVDYVGQGRSQWPPRLRHGSAAARFLGFAGSFSSVKRGSLSVVECCVRSWTLDNKEVVAHKGLLLQGGWRKNTPTLCVSNLFRLLRLSRNYLQETTPHLCYKYQSPQWNVGNENEQLDQ